MLCLIQSPVFFSCLYRGDLMVFLAPLAALSSWESSM
jgi:hypothetical protein